MTAENTTNSLVYQIDQLLDEASTLARTETDSVKFFETLLQRATLAIQSQAAAIWMLGSDSHPVAIANHQLSKLANKANKSQTVIDGTIRECIQTGQAKKLISNGTASTQSALSIFCCPFDSGDGSTESAIAIYFSKQIDPDLADVYVSFTEAIAEIAADFGSRKLSRSTSPNAKNASSNSSDWNKFKSLSDALHENLNVQSTAISLVNHGRSFYSCDRVMLALKRGRQFKVIAASGAATVNRKSETVAAIESLVAKAFYRNDKPIVFHSADDAPPRLQPALSRYQEIAGHDFLFLSPLSDKNGRVKFVQIIESVEEGDVARILKRVTMAEPQTRSALTNALQFQSIPMRGLLSAVGGSQLGLGLRRLFFPLALLTVLGLALAALCIFQTDMTVVADGNIVPETAKNVFAAKDGVITKLHVEHDDHVRAGQLLVEMSSNKMEADLARMVGDIETEKKRLSAIEAVKSSIDRGSREGQRELGRLSSQEIEAQQRINNLNLELTQLEGEKKRLLLASPIDGTVVTRDAKTKLVDRPVHRGDALLRLVADDGKWLAEIRVPDSRIAHLMKLKPEQASVPVSLSVATFPERKFDGLIRSVANTADIDEATGQAFIIVSVEVENDSAIAFQPGSSVKAEFNCGQTSVGYAWFNEFIDSLRYRFF